MYHKSEKEIRSRLKLFLWENRKLTGAKVLLALLASPEKSLHVFDLACLINQPNLDSGSLEAISKCAFTPIPTADAQALNQYRIRLQELQNRPPHPQATWEIDWLKKELRAITTPGGAIKNQYPELKKAYASYKMAVNRLLKRAEKQGEAQLARHIRRHLKTGLCFSWNEP